MLIELNHSSLLEEALANIRDKNTKPPRFRKNLRKIGRYLVYEAAKNFDLINKQVETPLEKSEVKLIKNKVVIISVLRAALPMVDAIFEEFDTASLGVVSASRGEMLDSSGKEFKIESDYKKIPNLNNKIAIIVDPMLATSSTILYLLELVKNEKPVKIVLISAIASKYGIDRIESKHPDVEIYTAAVDNVLNDKGYIVPGLGDAGDRACNTSH